MAHSSPARGLGILRRPILACVILLAAGVAGVGEPATAADSCTNILYGGASGGIAETILYELDPVTGAVSRVIGSTQFVNVGAIAIHPVTGVMYGAWSGGELIRIDRDTGLGTLVGPMVNTSTNFGLMDLSFRISDDQLFLTAQAASALEVGLGLFKVSPATGYASVVGRTGIQGGGNALAFDAEDILYHTTGARFNGDDGTVNIMNASTGLSTVLQSLIYQGFPFEGTDPRINAMDFHPVTGTLYVSANFGSDGEGNTYLATLDPITGVVSHLGLSTGSLEALAWGNDCGDADPCTIDRCEPGPAGLHCTHAGAPDTDGDGLCDGIESCPGVANPGQEDSDGDGTGDVCDTCPFVADPDQRNSDGDGKGDLCDTCPYDATNVDSDGDGLCDDGDGSGTASDAPCAVTRLPTMPCDDNCRHAHNPAQTDTDLDGLGDVCDACTDRDGDGFGDPGFPGDTCPTDNCGIDGSRLTNGEFEANSFAGWTRTVVPTCCGAWSINVIGTPMGFVSRSGPSAANARGGRYHAYTNTFDNSSPLTLALSQPFSIPPGAARVRVSYQMFVNNVSGAPLVVNPAGLDHTQGENHHARVDLLYAGSPTLDTGAGVVRNLYIGLDPGPLPNPYRDFEFDVTGDVTPGSSYVLRFAISTTHPAIHLGVDNVRVLVDLGQPDADGDATGDLCDCATLDPSAGRPGAISDLLLTSTGSWTWSPQAAADQYQVTRGLLSSLDVGHYGPCFTSVAAPPLPLDQDIPPPGDGFIYLVQGKDASCGGLGSLGYSNLGDWPGAPASAERINLDPLACP